MEFLFRHRGEGKRQVKPSQDIALLEDQLAGESSDDSEYKVGSGGGDSHSDGSDDDSSSTSSSSDDEDNESNASIEDPVVHGKEISENVTTKELLALARSQSLSGEKDLPEWLKNLKVCGCCLGESSSESNEIVECDGCGISVHEGCYGVSETCESVASTVSSASTEPWFCEPCRAGLESPPPCELCPLVGGVYKATDAGRWVHLVCALYAPGVAFGNTNEMTNVTIFEMNYIQWGRKACSICSESPRGNEMCGGARFCRTGVCIQCDAGLCKAFFHPSCAQAAGLLSEPKYVTTSASAENVMDAYLAHCKLHTDKSVIKQRRRTFLVHLVQNNYRRRAITARNRLAGLDKDDTVISETADERILRKLAKSRCRYSKDRSTPLDPWVPTQKLPRLLGTSASAIRKVQRMGEINDVDVPAQVRQEVQIVSVVEAKKKWGIPPAFNLEFVAYYHDREKRIESLKKLCSSEQANLDLLRNRDTMSRKAYDDKSKLQRESSRRNNFLRREVELYRGLLASGGQAIPKAVPRVPKSSSTSSNSKQQPLANAKKVSPTKGGHIKSCGLCKKSHDQHLLAHCDTCHLFYHLGCLSPPLTRMPKKSKLYGWSCSECYPDSSSEEDERVVLDGDLDIDLAKRRQRRTAATSKPSRLTNYNEDDDELLMRRAIKESKKKSMPPAKKRKTSKPSSLQPTLPQPQSNSDGLASTPDITKATPDTSISNNSPNKDGPVSSGQADEEQRQRQKLIDKAAAKAEKKRLKKEEKARRKAEKKEFKRQMKIKLQQTPHENGGHGKTDVDHGDDEDEDDSDVEILDDNSYSRPIKLTIKGFEKSQNSSNGVHAHHTPVHSGNHDNAVAHTNGHVNGTGSVSLLKLRDFRRTKTTPNKDLRTNCDKCSGSGSNLDLVRCDDCRKCFHFGCLMPPLKKSPKVPGYGWHCNECDPSDQDSDWHL